MYNDSRQLEWAMSLCTNMEILLLSSGPVTKFIADRKSKDQIKIKFKSKSFLKNQVRSMVGCLKYLGEKKWNLKKFAKIIKMKDRRKVAPPAPAHGLYLEKIIY